MAIRALGETAIEAIKYADAREWRILVGTALLEPGAR